MTTNNRDNITNRATKYKAQKHKHRNTMIKKEQNKTQKSVQLCSIMKIAYQK